MNDLEHDQLRIRIVVEGTKAAMKWSGRIGDDDPGSFLIPYFDEIIETLPAGHELEIDFMAMEFLNSSTVSTVLHLLALCSEHNIRTSILFKKDSHWQRVSFGTVLQVLAKHLRGFSVFGR